MTSNQPRQETEHAGPEKSLKMRVLGALGFSLILLLVMGIYAIDRTNQQHMVSDIQSTVDGAINLYQMKLQSDALQMASLIDVISRDKSLMDCLARKDRDALLQKSSPLFRQLKEESHITHFYFTGPDRVNIVRIHNPPESGDTINRYTTMEALRTGKLFYGVELGRYGLFTLRVVKPIFSDGKLIGFIELGREIEYIMSEIKKVMGVDLYVTYFKSLINREQWEKGMRLMGRSPDWNGFEKVILAEATATPSADEIRLLQSAESRKHIGDMKQTEYVEDNGDTFTFATPLKDVAGKEVGDLWIHIDFSTTSQVARDYIRTITMAGALLVMLLMGFLYLILDRVQRAIRNYRDLNLEEARQREDIKQRHLDQMTARKREIEEQAERMEAILDTAMDGIISIDVNGNILTFNQAASAIFGYSEEEVRGESVKLLMPEPYRNRFDAWLATCLVEGDDRIIGKSIESTALNRRGREVPINLAVNEVRLHGERSFTAVIHDISDRKRAEIAMQQRNTALEISNRELQDFAYVASHDLQEPLRKIRAFGDRLKSRADTSLDDKGRDYLARMLDAAERMQVLISSLLSYSRITTQAKPFDRVNLNEVVTGVISDLETRIEAVNGRVEVAPLPELDVDSLQMRQLFQNLIGNALKFRRPDVAPVVRISAHTVAGQRPAMWEIQVADNGIGFEEKYATRVFEVFERLHSRADYEGTGIGLAVCRKIAERHGGTISVRSKPGEGSTFSVILPEKQKKKVDDSISYLTEDAHD
ncbi:PAS domain S-box protein [Mariprofundus erugo]|uniref:PAS domain S-box protein n=1 Tax=Mariprofundus erugo TaxID=2528639 RepID=UPI0010FD35B6|nr:PAS domain S-box protein [Mariprofundus erugo]TLS73538.1 PAS domain S-box protein [Mariprofundus erugo]